MDYPFRFGSGWLVCANRRDGAYCLKISSCCPSLPGRCNADGEMGSKVVSWSWSVDVELIVVQAADRRTLAFGVDDEEVGNQ